MGIPQKEDPGGNAWTRYLAKRDAIQAVKDRYHADYVKLTTAMQAELDDIERDFADVREVA